MLTVARPSRRWSEVGIRVLICAVIAAVVFALLDGLFRGELLFSDHRVLWQVLSTSAFDLRALADTAVLASTIFIVGAKFIETRSILTVGFDKLDAAKIVVKGPDDENIVWIGHRYGTSYEAEVVANVFAERLKESAAT
jgi:hypothetical protein